LLRASLLLIAARHPDRAFTPDSSSYIDPAAHVLANGAYPSTGTALGTFGPATRTPGYPLFIALIYWLGGQDPFLIILVQVMIGTLTVYFTFRLGRRLLLEPPALLGALLLAVNPESITHVFYLLTETLFACLLVAAVLAWLKGHQEKRLLSYGIAALLMGACTMVRSIAVWFPMILWPGWLFGDRADRRRRLALSSLFVGVYLLTLMPWFARNLTVLGYPTLSTVANYNMLYSFAASLEADLRDVGEEEIRQEYLKRVAQALAERGWDNTEAIRARVQDILAHEIIAAHPVRYVYLHLKGNLNSLLPDVTSPSEILGTTVSGKGTLAVLHREGIVAALRHYYGPNLWQLWLASPIIFLLGLVYLFGLVGAIDLLRRRCWLAAFVLLSPPVYFLLVPGPAGQPRFRVPVIPFFCLLAGAGIHCAWRRMQRSQEARATDVRPDHVAGPTFPSRPGPDASAGPCSS
jgi:4-amino-4-deoxy-L-arabinose transferase-like glycosyltransferase